MPPGLSFNSSLWKVQKHSRFEILLANTWNSIEVIDIIFFYLHWKASLIETSYKSESYISYSALRFADSFYTTVRFTLVCHRIFRNNVLLLLISSLNLHYMYHRLLCTQKQNFIWIWQKRQTFLIDPNCKNRSHFNNVMSISCMLFCLFFNFKKWYVCIQYALYKRRFLILQWPVILFNWIQMPLSAM